MSRARSKKSNSAAKSDSDDVVWGLGINSYAQNFEDVMLWRALGQVKEGFYIDVGAQDPVIDSVSLAFYEHGWHGLHVEPVPHYANLLRQQRPGDTVIQAALGDAASIMRFYEIPGTGISTADPAIAARHEQRGFQTVEALVPCMTLASLFESVASREIHWLKIDVEGFSWAGASPLSGRGLSSSKARCR
jgi:FkbM family methyltransferase